MKLLFSYKRFVVFLGLLFFFPPVISIGQEKYLHFTEVDGIPRNITTCIEQDRYGYIWIGTTNGVARYDGKNFYTFKELSGISVISLLNDSLNNIWAATYKGLYKLNRLTNFFELIVKGYITKINEDQGEIYYLMTSNIFKVSGNTIKNIYSGKDISDFCFTERGLWLGNSSNGVKLLTRESGYKKVEATFLKNKSVTSLNKINDKLFVGIYNGQIYSINTKGELEQIKIDNHYFLKEIVKINQEYWLATDGNGIIILDNNLLYLRSLKRNPNSNASINSNSIYDIYYSQCGEIWLATYGVGLTCILPDNLLFQNLLPERGNHNSLVANEATSVFVKDNYFFFGTNYGMSVWNKNTQNFTNLSSEKFKSELLGTKVTAITKGEENNIWVGTYDGLLGKYNPNFNLLKAYHPSTVETGAMQQIIFLYNVGNSNMLIQTQFPSRILMNFDTQTETTSVFELYFKGSKITYCTLGAIRKNQRGELLAVISGQGLFHVNLKDNVLENKLPKMNKQLTSYINDYYQDKKGFYWITTSSDGLLRISEDGKGYKKYTVTEGLPSNTLIRIESIDDHYLWISSISGICRFDKETGEVMNFNHSDGLPANEFLERSSAKTNDGRLIFGSMAGFTIIDPSKVNSDTVKTEVIISDITFQNQSIRAPEQKLMLKQPLEETKELWLPYNKNSFSIHFFAKSKNYIKYHNYSYRLIGLEKHVNYISETNFANYTNLSPGTYIFEVKSADKTKGGKPTRLTIHIQAPWYLSWYAYTAYAIILFTIIYLSAYSYQKRFELRKEKEMSEFKIQKEHELTEKKLAFFTNVSHDLKTPLTLIDAPVSDLLRSKNLSPEQVKKLSIISRSSKRLYKLITDLLEFRKITQKHMVLKVKEAVISDIIIDISEAFTEECKSKTINLKCTVSNNIIGFVDVKKIEKILWNLLSNALKFTNKGGSILLNVNELTIDGHRKLRLEVNDNGIGIPENEKNKIFDHFYKANNSAIKNQEGTGIGLSVVKELVEIHHGNIKLESTVGIGTTFTVIVPCDRDCFSDNEIVEHENTNYLKPGIENVENLESDSTQFIQKQYNLPGILIVEDNAELRDYLKDHFAKKYKVYIAEDGLEGLKLAKEFNPDIILTDIQMPNMNGYEFCQEIRLNFDTSHIPVIMLTANSAIEHQIEGLSTGADAYLTKPFDIQLLDIQIHTSLENRKKLRNKFQGIDLAENLERNLPKKDIDFILELKLYIEKNLMNSEMSVELLATHFAVSLAQLHRKIKALTGTTPNNLIKSIRLKKAYHLIKEKGFRVSEAAYQSGFSDPNYFTVCFKKEFGENPSQIETSKKDSTDSSIFKNINKASIIKNTLNKNDEEGQNREQLPLMLIAEDNQEMNSYISAQFKTQYRVIAAYDGNTAYEKAFKEIPDIIISDIMMPGLDGVELCRRIKNDERTSHIPFVLLTAKNTDESTIEGLEQGADDYISKPFNNTILKTRVRNLYQSRLLLRNKFKNEPEATVKEISPSSSDERFLKKAYEIVEKYLSEPNFDVQLFSSELGMSRAQLYRKIKGVSDQSVNEFVRIVRLKKAADLLLEPGFQISDIAEKVGFNSFAYFTKSFKEYFGVTPSQYKR